MGCHTWVYKKIMHLDKDHDIRIAAEKKHTNDKSIAKKAYKHAKNMTDDQLRELTLAYCSSIAIELHDQTSNLSDDIKQSANKTSLNEIELFIAKLICWGEHSMYYMFEDSYVTGNDDFAMPEKSSILSAFERHISALSSFTTIDKLRQFGVRLEGYGELSIFKHNNKICLFEEVMHNPFRIYNAYDKRFDNIDDLKRFVNRNTINFSVDDNREDKQLLLTRIDDLYAKYPNDELLICFG